MPKLYLLIDQPTVVPVKETLNKLEQSEATVPPSKDRAKLTSMDSTFQNFKVHKIVSST